MSTTYMVIMQIAKSEYTCGFYCTLLFLYIFAPRAAPPLQEPAESGQRALNMPHTHSREADKDKT